MKTNKVKSKSADLSLFDELSQLIEQSHQHVISQVNSELTLLFWNIGNRINKEILKHKRADYGKQIVSTLSTQLKEKYGRNFELGNLRRMIQFSNQFPNAQIVVPLARQLSWSHFLGLIPLKSNRTSLYNSNVIRN